MSKTSNSNSNSNNNNKKTFKKKYKLKQTGGNNSINVLNWNICWEAMVGDIVGQGSAPILGATCSITEINRRTKLNECATNVIKLIDNLNIDYDFVAIQEAAKWKDIYKYSKKLKPMGYVHHIIGSSHLVTFYNKEKYDAIAVVTDTIIHNNRRGRPYHIIYLKNKITSEFYIFINLHNADGVSIDDLENQLARKFDNFFSIDKTEQEHSEKLKVPTQIRWSKNNYNVIVAGDFNDRGLRNYWMGLKPFKYTNIPNLTKLEVKCNVEPPKTCCRQLENTSPLNHGDYILVNSSLAIEKNNYIPKSDHLFPSSDHLPVLIELKSRTAVSAPIHARPRTRHQVREEYDIVEPVKPPIEPDEESDEIEEPPETIQSIKPPETIKPPLQEQPPKLPSETQSIKPPLQEQPPKLPPETLQPPLQEQPPKLPPETQPLQTQPLQPIQPIQTIQPLQTQPLQTQPLQTQPIQTQPIQTQPIQPTQLIQPQPETRPAQPETRPAQPETRPAQPEARPAQPETRPASETIPTPETGPTMQAPIEKTETESSNMFSAPLLAMIVAIPIIFLLSK